MIQKLVLEDETPRSEDTQLPKEKQTTSANSTVTNEAISLKPKDI